MTCEQNFNVMFEREEVVFYNHCHSAWIRATLAYGIASRCLISCISSKYYTLASDSALLLSLRGSVSVGAKCEQ